MASNIDAFRTLRNRPHVVILGAGASVAAIPCGDKYGRKISVMDGFIDNLGMRDILAGINFKSENLEDIYSELSAHAEYDEIRETLESTIRSYFLKYRLPDEPTIYDLLLLSLKAKDAVATFNWDPLLLHAYYRVSAITKKLPQLLFLHGNVAVSICQKDNIQFWGPNGRFCRKCNSLLTPCKLLYPVRQKKYTDDVYIKKQWDGIRHFLSQAYIVTIFGYSAPATDVEAIELLKNAWGDVAHRKLEQIEIIDIKDHSTLRSTWDKFIYVDHYQIHKSFFDSLIAQSPRRTTEDLFSCLMEGKWLDFSNRLPQRMSWDEVKKHFAPILAEEEKAETQNDK